MRKLFILFLVTAGLALPAAAQPELELSPYPSPYGGEIIDVESPDVETLYFHITEPGLWHVSATSFHWEVVDSEPDGWGLVELISEDVVPSNEFQGSQWYSFGTIKVTGTYCTTVSIQIDLTVQNNPPLWSNKIYKHIVPEPASMLLLGLGAGVAVLRRRRA